jgi:hypothetical protein
MRDGGNQDTSQDEEEESISEDEVANLLPETLLPADGDAAVGGKDVYKFQTRNRKVAGRMAEMGKVMYWLCPRIKSSKCLAQGPEKQIMTLPLPQLMFCTKIHLIFSCILCC